MKRRRSRGTRVVRVGWTHPETEEDFEVECEVSAGSPEQGPTYDCAGVPADPGEVEIIAVADEKGRDRSDLIPLVEKDFDRIEERAFEEAGDAARDEEEARAEYRAEMAREERWERRNERGY